MPHNTTKIAAAMTIAHLRREEPERGGPSPEGAPDARLEPTGP